MSYVLATQGLPPQILAAGVNSVAGTGLSDSLLVPSQAKFIAGLGARTLTGGLGADTLIFTFNPNGLGDSAWQGVSGWEYALLIGGGYQNLTLGANAEAAFTGGVITLMAASTTGMNLDGSALSALSSLKVIGGSGGDVIRGGAGADQMWATAGNDSLYLGGGNDLVEVGAAALLLTTYVDGGSGFDIVRLTGGGAVTDAAFGNKQNIERVLLNEAAWTFTLGNGAASAFSGLVDIDASYILTGVTLDANGMTNGRLFAQGSQGADAITGGNGDDTIIGGGGADTLTGGTGNDLFRFGTNIQLNGTTMSGGDGFDQVEVTGDNVGFGNFALSAGAGLEQVTLSFASSPLYAFFNNLDAAAFTDGLIRVAAPNTNQMIVVGNGLTGNNAVYVFGSTGANEVYSGAGADTLRAGVGVGSSNYFAAGDGNDIARFDNGANAVVTGAAFGNAFLFGGNGIDTLSLGSLVTTVTDTQLANKTGWEVLQFDAAGTLTVTLGANALTAFASGPTIFAPNATKLVLTNSSANGMTLTGTVFADSITGGSGNDIFIGNGGADTLKGGAGVDRFLFTDGNQLANAALVNGEGGEDYLEFANGSGVGDQALAKAQNFEVISFTGTGYSQVQIGNAGAAAFSSSVISIVQGAGITQSNTSASGLTSKGINFYGAAGNPDYVEGSQMADQFFGYGGADNLRGDGGDDGFTFDNVTSFSQLAYLDGGSGYDTVAIGGVGTVTDAMFAQVRNVENLFSTGVGAKVMTLGNNAAQAFASGPVLVQAYAGAGPLTVDASAMTNNSLYAIGGAGNDTLTGSALGDVLFGGAGSDTFRFGANAGTDVVLDFVSINKLNTLASSVTVTLDGVGAGVPLGFGGGAGILGAIDGFTVSGTMDYGALKFPDYTNTYGPNGFTALGGGGDNVGYAQGAITFTAAGGRVFDFNSIDLVSAFRDNIQVTVTGMLNGVSVASQVVNLGAEGVASAVQLGVAFNTVDVVTLAVTNVGNANGGAYDSAYFGFDNLVFNKFDTDKIFVAGVTNGAQAQLLIDQANLLAQYIPSGDTLLIGNDSQVLLAGLLPSQLSVNDFIFA